MWSDWLVSWDYGFQYVCPLMEKGKRFMETSWWEVGCESWTIKKVECQRIDAFELCCWRRLLRVPWTARRSNQNILKEISPEYSLEELMLKLKLQYFGHLMQELTHLKRPWCWERLKAGGEGDNRGWDGWMASPTQWTWVWVNSESWQWTGRPGVLQSKGSQRVGHNWATELNLNGNLCMRQRSQNQYSVTTYRGGMEREVEGKFKREGHMYTFVWFMLMYGRNHHNIVIILQFKIK